MCKCPQIAGFCELNFEHDHLSFLDKQEETMPQSNQQLEQHWKSTFHFSEIVNNLRFMRGTVCQIVKFISQFSLELYI